MHFWPHLPSLLIHGVQHSDSRVESQGTIHQGHMLGWQCCTQVCIAIGQMPHPQPGSLGLNAQRGLPLVHHPEAEWNQCPDLGSTACELNGPLLRLDHCSSQVVQAICNALSLPGHACRDGSGPLSLGGNSVIYVSSFFSTSQSPILKVRAFESASGKPHRRSGSLPKSKHTDHLHCHHRQDHRGSYERPHPCRLG